MKCQPVAQAGISVFTLIETFDILFPNRHLHYVSSLREPSFLLVGQKKRSKEKAAPLPIAPRA